MPLLRLHSPKQYAPPLSNESSVDDLSLMQRLAAGDVAALTVLMNAYWRPLTAYASRVLDDMDLAEDIAEDVFIHAWRARARWKPGCVRTYLFTVARNLCLDELRRQKSRAGLAQIERQCDVLAVRTPAEVLEERQRTEVVDKAIQDLPLRQREVFELVYLRRLTYRDAAAIMQISPKTVGNQLSEALRKLRQMLRPLLTGSSGQSSPAKGRSLLPDEPLRLS